MKKDVIILFYPTPWPGRRGRAPYALFYLERMIRDLGLTVILIDEQVEGDYLPVVQRVKDRLLMAGVSAMTGYQILGGIQFSKAIKECSDCPVVWGGWHPTLLPQQTLDEPFIDMLVLGQGEIPFQKLVPRLLNSQEVSDIPNVACKKNGRIVVNDSPGKFSKINAFPPVDYSLIDINNYVYKSAYSERCVGYFASHGCPFECAFCCVAEVFGKKWFHKETGQIIADLRHFKETARIDSVTFDDDNAFVNRKFTIELCHALMESGLNLQWDTIAHAGLFLRIFSEDDIALLRRAGCRQIAIGAESGDQTVLDSISKRTTVEDNIRFVEVLKRHQITPLFSTMICFPEDPDRDTRLTLEMIRKAKLADRSLRARIFFYTPYPGTELYAKAIEKGFVPPAKLEEWARHTLRKFHAPWWPRDYRWRLEIFANFYLPLANPLFYKFAPANVRPIAFIVNMFFHPIVRLRFKWNFFRAPVEAVCFLLMLRLFNKLMRTNYSLGYESYLA